MSSCTGVLSLAGLVNGSAGEEEKDEDMAEQTAGAKRPRQSHESEANEEEEEEGSDEEDEETGLANTTGAITRSKAAGVCQSTGASACV